MSFSTDYPTTWGHTGKVYKIASILDPAGFWVMKVDASWDPSGKTGTELFNTMDRGNYLQLGTKKVCLLIHSWLNNSSSPSHSSNRLHSSATTNTDGRYHNFYWFRYYQRTFLSKFHRCTILVCRRGLAQIDCKLNLEGGRIAQSHARRCLTLSVPC